MGADVALKQGWEAPGLEAGVLQGFRYILNTADLNG